MAGWTLTLGDEMFGCLSNGGIAGGRSKGEIQEKTGSSSQETSQGLPRERGTE